MAFSHLPVMLRECIEALNIRPDGIYLDGTAGGAGHSRAIAQSLGSGHLYALDQDPDAVSAAAARLDGLPATVIEGNFRDAPALLAAQDVRQINGALLDLGVSSHQLDSAARGFSYHQDAPLDMRMSQSGPTAADLVNGLERQALADIFRKWGEEPYAWQVAGKIVAARETAAIETTGQLAELVISAMPPAVRRKSKNPARRVYQALRMEVNGEMDALEAGLEGIFEMLAPGGRLAVMTFHSIEDRMVKQRFRAWSTACTCPPELPVCVCGGVAQGKLMGKNPQVAAPQEVEENPRSRSAKLRVIEKIYVH